MHADDKLDDVRLIERCRAGDAAAWSALVQRYRRLIYAVPRRGGLAGEDAADVFQTVFVALLGHLDRIADPSRLHAWLVTTAKRETLRVLRAERAVLVDGAEIDSVPDTARLPDEVVIELQENQRLRTAFARLDSRCKELLGALYLSDEPVSYAAIAARLDCPEGSIGPTRSGAHRRRQPGLQQGRPVREAVGSRNAP